MEKKPAALFTWGKGNTTHPPPPNENPKEQISLKINVITLIFLNSKMRENIMTYKFFKFFDNPPQKNENVLNL